MYIGKYYQYNNWYIDEVSFKGYPPIFLVDLFSSW